MEKKVFKLGFCIGRFQPFHNGHARLIRAGLDIADTVIVGVGSAQESRTKRNPFSFKEREEMILKEFPSAIVVPINDHDHPSDDFSWGDHLMKILKEVIIMEGIETIEDYDYPDLIISGTEPIRNFWFEEDKYPQTNFLFLNRGTDNISGTAIREGLLDETDYSSILALPGSADIEFLKRILKETQND